MSEDLRSNRARAAGEPGSLIASMTAPPILTSIADLAMTTDAWLCDVWGVLHDGQRALDGAAEACAAFRQKGGIVLLLSNAPRPAADVAAQLAGLGIGPNAFDAILTSGEVTRRLLDTAPWAGPVLHVGPARHAQLFEGTAAQRVAEDTARAVICTGLLEIDPNEQPDAYTAQFQRLAARGLPMLCANPDVRVESGGALVWCAGALAQSYAALGGTVVHAGKPHAAIYAAARDRLRSIATREIPDTRILAIGDGVETDLRGADREGLRAVYIASRIHMPEPLTETAATRLFTAHSVAPVAAMARLTWA
jgi:HAD superfamily hydrolase (TIGR01459 family)